MLAAADPEDPDSLDNWPKYQELMAHVGPSSVAECTNVDVRRLVTNVRAYLYNIGDYTTCLTEIDQALEQWQVDSHENDRDVLVMSGQKARVLWALGRYEQAGQIRRHNLERVRVCSSRLLS